MLEAVLCGVDGVDELRNGVWSEFVVTGAYRAIEASRIHQEMVAKAAERLRGCGQVIDLGCGMGALTERLLGQSSCVTAVDANKHMLAATRRRVGDGIAKILQADVTRLAVPDGHYDGAGCLNVLFNLPDPARAYGEARRILKPGGKYVISGPLADVAPQEIERIFSGIGHDALAAGLGQESVEAALALNQRMLRSGQMDYRPTPSRLLADLEAHGMRPLSFERIYENCAYLAVAERV